LPPRLRTLGTDREWVRYGAFREVSN